MIVHIILKILMFIFALNVIGCGNSDLIDVAEGIPRRPIDRSILAINAFFNDSRFGTVPQQFDEVRNTLGINSVRLLFAWNDSVQASPNSEPFFGFYDSIASEIPADMDAIVVLTGIPSWMSNSANWIDGDPRKTFVELWIKKVATRYASNSRIIGYEIWNEQNMVANPDNVTLDIATSPTNYISLLTYAFNAIRSISSSKLVLNGATTSINQNFPGTLDYNKAMSEAGVMSVVDIFAAHYYGKEFERVVISEGVADFLNSLGKEVWLTESGAQGVNSQLPYGEEAWPFLTEKIPAIKRIYIYQFVESTPADSTYGLRNLTPGMELSDLYIFLRDR